MLSTLLSSTTNLDTASFDEMIAPHARRTSGLDMRGHAAAKAREASGHKAVVSGHLSQRQKLRHKRSIPGGFTQEEWERSHNF